MLNRLNLRVEQSELTVNTGYAVSSEDEEINSWTNGRCMVSAEFADNHLLIAGASLPKIN